MAVGYLTAFLFIFCLAIGIFCFGYAAKKSSPLYVLLLENGLGFFIVLILLIVAEKLSVNQLVLLPDKENWLWLTLASISGFAGGNYFALVNLRTAGEKINALLSPSITALTVLLSFFIFNEKLQWMQALGILVTIIAVFYFLFRSINASTDYHASKTGAISGLITVILIASSIIFSIRGAANISILHAVGIRLLIALVFVTIIFLFAAKSKVNHNTKLFYTIVLLGVLVQTVLAGYLWYYASFSLGLPVFQTIIATLPLWVYAADVYIFKKSKPSSAFIITSLIAAAGVGLTML